MTLKQSIASLLFIALIFSSCATVEHTGTDEGPHTHHTLYSTLWMQQSAEYAAISYQPFNTAMRLIPYALEDSTWTASLEQGEDYMKLPPAIILDLDETAIDNSFYQARVIRDNSEFDIQTWNRWVREAKADAIKGSVEFTQRAADLGINVFYITNREAEVEPETIDNLEELGFPVQEGSVMSNGARPSWTSDKIQRRTEVSKNYRVMMIFGDDLNDFLPARNRPVEERKELAERHSDKWGIKWFILPNPVYGSWERALFYNMDNLTDEERRQHRLDLLIDKED